MSSSELCDSSLGRVIPALQNRMSSRPYRSTQTSIIRSLSARRLTSAWTKHAMPPACAMARTTASASASCTSARTRRAPCCAKRRALARPMPLPAPVMTAALPSRALLAGGTEALACGAQTLDAQLHLVVVDEVARRALAQAHARWCAGGNDDVVVRTRDGGRRLEEEDGLIGDGHAGLAGVVAIIEPDAHDLAGPANRGPQARVIRDNGGGGAILGEPADEPLETARREEGFVVIGGDARSVDAPAVG